MEQIYVVARDYDQFRSYVKFKLQPASTFIYLDRAEKIQGLDKSKQLTLAIVEYPDYWDNLNSLLAVFMNVILITSPPEPTVPDNRLLLLDYSV